MINFFRKIRFTYLSKNKSGKYIKYAFGEIILVMAGILLALQVNTWNEKRKENILEKGYYCHLLEDVEQDIQQIDSFLVKVQARISSANQAIRLLKSEDALKLDVAKALGFSINEIVADFSLNNSAFEDLKSGANLNIIKDKDIIKTMNNYFKKGEQRSSIIKVNGEIALDRFFAYEDLYATGWVHFSMLSPRFINHMEEDVKELMNIDERELLSEEMKFQLTNDALRYISSNARQFQLYKDMKAESAQVMKLLITKCNQKG